MSISQNSDVAACRVTDLGVILAALNIVSATRLGVGVYRVVTTFSYGNDSIIIATGVDPFTFGLPSVANTSPTIFDVTMWDPLALGHVDCSFSFRAERIRPL